MKSDVIQYVRAYQRLKHRIESGSLPVGAKLPGRSVLCRKLGTSERTIRRALELLEQDGFLEITPRKRPTVVSSFASPEGRALQSIKKADPSQVNDLMQTADLLCYPIYLRGLRMCTGGDWQTPEMILSKMDPKQPREFWQLSNLLWRFFIARNENELLLRAVDSLGFRGKETPQSSLKDRMQYRDHIETLFQTAKSGDVPGQEELEAIFFQFRTIAEQAGQQQFLHMRPPCHMLAEAKDLESQLSLAQERYSSVCLDLLGLIAMGRYQSGDRLPTHAQLQAAYHVSRDTTVKAVRMLQDWGVVTAAPRRGISVVMDVEGLQRIPIAPEAIACHVRRYLDSLDLLSLTVEKVAKHAAAHASQKEAQRMRNTLERQLEQPYEHQLIPRTLLNFVTEQIQYDALQSIYKVLTWNLSIGRGIPRLASRDWNPTNTGIYQQCIEAADCLCGGDVGSFAQSTAAVYERVRCLIAAECRRLGYWEASMGVYDGSLLWQ